MSNENETHGGIPRGAGDEDVATSKTDGGETEPLGGAMSGEDDYVAVNSGGVSGERHTPKGSEEVGKGSDYDPAAERYPDEETGDPL